MTVPVNQNLFAWFKMMEPFARNQRDTVARNPHSEKGVEKQEINVINLDI